MSLLVPVSWEPLAASSEPVIDTYCHSRFDPACCPFSLLPQMPKRNADNPSSQRANKRVRSSLPKFRVATNPNADRTSRVIRRVTILPRGSSGRRRYKTEYIVHPPSKTGPPDISIDQQWETDEKFLDLPVNLDDSATTATPNPETEENPKKHNLGEFSISIPRPP